MSTYAVAGVTGRVGSVVANELLARGHQVRGISRDATRAAAWSKGQGARDAVTGSLDDRAFLTKTLVGTAGFFVVLPEDPFAADFHGIRRGMADAIAAAVEQSAVPHVVLLSAIAAVVADGNGPAKDLHYLEEALRATTTKLTIIRACWFQENVASVLGAANMGVYPNLMASSEIAYPTIASRDVGAIAASLLVAPPSHNEVVDLIGPSYSALELAAALGAALGKPLQVVNVPALARVSALVEAGLPQSFAEDVGELYSSFESGRIRPQGDRSLVATTTIQETLPNLLAR